MAVTLKQAASATATSVTMTSTASGDYLIVWSYNSAAATVPTLLAGYTDIVNAAGTQQAARCAYKVSAGGETTSGVWTSATAVVCMNYSGVGSIGTNGGIQAGSSTSCAWTAFTASVIDGTSLLLAFGGAKSATTGMNGNTANFTNRTSQLTANGLDFLSSNGQSGTQSLTISPTSRWQTLYVELKVPLVGPTQQQKSSFFQFL